MVFLPQAAQLSSQGGEPKAPQESCQRPPPPVPWVNSAWLVCQFLIVELLPPSAPPLHALPAQWPGAHRSTLQLRGKRKAKTLRDLGDPRTLEAS